MSPLGNNVGKCVFALALLAILYLIYSSLVDGRDSWDPPRSDWSADRLARQHSSADLAEAQLTRESAPAPENDGSGDLIVNAKYDSGGIASGLMIWVWKAGGDPTVRCRRGKTDELGTLRLNSLEPGEYAVMTPCVPRIKNLRTIAIRGHAASVCNLVVDVVATITGIVENESGGRVPFAKIVYAPFALSGHPLAEIGECDVTGEFSIAVGHTPMLIGARASMYGPSRLQLIQGGKHLRRRIAIQLTENGGDVRGRIVDSRGKAIAGAYVQIGDEALDGLTGGLQGVDAPQSFYAYSDENGEWAIAGCMRGSYKVYAKARGYAKWTGDCSILASGIVEIVIQLRAGATIEGRILKRPGTGVGKVVVSATNAESTTVLRSKTAPDGAYFFDCVPFGKTLMHAEHPQFGRVEGEVEVSRGIAATWDGVLDAGLLVGGVVVTETGQAVPGARVTLLCERPEAPKSRTTHADNMGAFFFPNTDHIEGAVVEASGPYVAKSVRVGVVDPADRLRIVVATTTLEAPGRIVGCVAASRKGLLETATVSLLQKGGGGARIVWPDVESGVFTIDAVAPGWYQVQVNSSEGVPSISDWREMVAAETWDMGIVNLAPGGKIEVGRPFGLSRVSVLRVLSDETGEEVAVFQPGSWLSPDLRPGSYRVVGGGGGKWIGGSESVMVEVGTQRAVQLVTSSGPERSIRLYGGFLERSRFVRVQLIMGGVVIADRFVSAAKECVVHWPLRAGIYKLVMRGGEERVERELAVREEGMELRVDLGD